MLVIYIVTITNIVVLQKHIVDYWDKLHTNEVAEK